MSIITYASSDVLSNHMSAQFLPYEGDVEHKHTMRSDKSLLIIIIRTCYELSRAINSFSE